MAHQSGEVGRLVLIGGDEWRAGEDVLGELGPAGTTVLVVPTAAAFERPERQVEAAERVLVPLGYAVEVAMVLTRRDAEERPLAALVAAADSVLLVGGSPLHLRSVLKDSAVFAALVGAWRAGATVTGASEAAMALTDPMIDPRGGALTVGLGLVRELSISPHHLDDEGAQFRRTLALAPSSLGLVGLADRSALVRDPDGLWRQVGEHLPAVYLDGRLDSLASLAGKPVA